MIVIQNKLIPFGRKYYAINLCGIVFAKGPCGRHTLNHEKIHTAQMKEMLFLFFYLWYVVEWIIRAIRYLNLYKAYRNISFEREAYTHGDNFNYLKSRRFYSFINYL